LTLIVLVGAVAISAALFGPSWVDHRQNLTPHCPRASSISAWFGLTRPLSKS
jgi:hypothetical protein